MASLGREILERSFRQGQRVVRTLKHGADPIPVLMSPAERDLFESLLRCTRNYVEFGTGGNTLLAASRVMGSVISVGASQEWLYRVRFAGCTQKLLVEPILVQVDIGETTEWGFPESEERKEAWPSYHGNVWSYPQAAEANLYFLDGRFRVACAMQALLHARPEALIAIHDFSVRPGYHVVREVCREVASAETLSVFIRKPDCDLGRVAEILAAHSFDPA